MRVSYCSKCQIEEPSKAFKFLLFLSNDALWSPCFYLLIYQMHFDTLMLYLSWTEVHSKEMLSDWELR